MKVYVARVGGGFRQDAPAPPCQASDECHGPGTEAAPPPNIGTFLGVGGQFNRPQGTQPIRRCKSPRVKRHGRCVKARRPHKGARRNHG